MLLFFLFCDTAAHTNRDRATSVVMLKSVRHTGYREMITLLAFLRKRQVVLDPVMVELFWPRTLRDIPVYLSKSFTDSVGLTRSEVLLLLQRPHFSILRTPAYRTYVEQNKIDRDTYQYPDPNLFAEDAEHVLIEVVAAKNVCLLAPSPQARRFRQYLLQVEYLFVQYIREIWKRRFTSPEDGIEQLLNMPHIAQYGTQQDERYKGLGYPTLYIVHEEGDMEHVCFGYTYNLQHRLNHIQRGNSRLLVTCYHHHGIKAKALYDEMRQHFQEYRQLNRYKIRVEEVLMYAIHRVKEQEQA
jgi:hypothetical protein